MSPSGSYPSDDVTRIVTGCAEVICELESASHLPVRADRAPAQEPLTPSDFTQRICHQTPTAAAGRPRRHRLKTWIRRATNTKGKNNNG
jgi:hypothetical protein